MTDPKPRCDTLVSLRDYLETRMAAQQLALDNARELMEARMERAEVEMDRRLDALNHLRADTVNKGEYLAGHAGLTAEFHSEAATLRAEVAALKEWKAEQRGKASMASVYLSYGLALIGLIISLVTLVHGIMQ